MKEKVRFRMYTVSQCGYYKRGEQAPEFGSLDDVFRQIQEWIKGKSIKESGTYELRDGDKIYPTFCHSILSNDFGDYLVTTWNQVPSGEKFLASIAGNDLVGEAQVDLAEVPHGNIPGYPTYFWVIPSENKLITLQFSKGNNGIRNLKKYASNFMLFYSIFAVRKDAKKSPENDNCIDAFLDGYSPDPTSIPSQTDVHPRFETFLFNRSDQNIKYVKERLKLVIRLCHKRELHFDIPYEADLMEKAFSILGIREIPKLERPARMNYEINFESPSEEEFDTIISNWRKHIEEIDADNYWDDIGFKLVGDERIFWLNRVLMSKEFDLSVKRENEEMIKPESLMKEISERRAELLAGLII